MGIWNARDAQSIAIPGQRRTGDTLQPFGSIYPAAPSGNSGEFELNESLAVGIADAIKWCSECNEAHYINFKHQEEKQMDERDVTDYDADWLKDTDNGDEYDGEE